MLPVDFTIGKENYFVVAICRWFRCLPITFDVDTCGPHGRSIPDGKRLLFVEESDPPEVRELSRPTGRALLLGYWERRTAEPRGRPEPAR
jgi:hypothetical protein